MSTIYKNTFVAGLIGEAIAVGYNAIKKDDYKNTHGALVYSHAVVNLVEMIANQCFSSKEKSDCDKVFYSPSKAYFPSCTVVRKEFSYVDTSTKAISIVIALMTFIPKVGDFIKSNDIAFTILPGAVAVIGETVDNRFDLGLTWETGRIEDQSGYYTSYEL